MVQLYRVTIGLKNNFKIEEQQSALYSAPSIAFTKFSYVSNGRVVDLSRLEQIQHHVELSERCTRNQGSFYNATVLTHHGQTIDSSKTTQQFIELKSPENFPPSHLKNHVLMFNQHEASL